MEDFVFDTWVTDNKLSSTAASLLHEEGLTDADTLSLLTEELVDGFKLNIGDTLRIKRGLKSLKKGLPGPLLGDISTKSLAKDATLSSIVEDLIKSGKYVDDALSGDDKLKPTTGHDSKSKPLLIPDFIGDTIFGDESDEEEEIALSGASRFVVRTKKKKPSLDDISLSQWISANAYILTELIDRGSIDSLQAVKDYLSHTAKIGDFLQDNYRKSVLTYDNAFRKKQAKTGMTWARDEVHLAMHLLERRAKPQKPQTSEKKGQAGSARQPTPRDTAGSPICLDYNQEGGCKRAICKFSHTCLAQGCLQRHPQIMHSKLTAESGVPGR